MKPIKTALVFTFFGAAFVIASALLRIFHVVDRPMGYYILMIGMALGILGNVYRRRAAKHDQK